jgi:retron-type reverse transcriptase
MTTRLNLSQYLQLFRGREDYFAQQGEDWYLPVPRTLDEFYVRRHLEGDATFGLYVLNRASCCHLLCIDIDIPKSDLCGIDLKNPESKYGYLKDKLSAVLRALSGQLGVPRGAILLEDTGGRGYHIWVFFTDAVQGKTAVAFGEALKRHLDFEIEFFPKQGRLTPEREYGNLIKLPLGLHRKYGLRSFFFSLSAEGPQPIAGLEENLAHLQSLVPVPPEVIDGAVKAFAAEIPLLYEPAIFVSDRDQKRPQFEGEPDQLAFKCAAMRNLRIKAKRGDRLSHAEAFLFADVMLSVPGGTEFIHNTMRLSFRDEYDQTRTNGEIERIAPLYPPNCLILVRKGVCPGYCKESVRKRNADPLVPGTSPCSVWLKRAPTKPVIDAKNLIEKIGTAENLKRAFFRLKYYHEHEDALFFDPFDYEHFERRLDANSEIQAKALLEKIEFSFSGYLQVLLPKKLNEAHDLEYRRMSYSTIYDQAPIQALYDVVAPILENEFQSTSYGYRWNTDNSAPYRIFEDWREAYPRFRNEVMAALKRHPNGFHICCDIKGYYDHVDHSILLEQIRRLIPDAYVYQLIGRLVRAYESTEHRGAGLPQGPAYARLLANLYLNDFDVFARRLSAAYFRYVDDFVLVFENERDASQGLEYVVRRLRDLGLELSQDEAKKAVIEPNIDISRVRKTLDKIHYGILEGTRHVEHLAPKAAADFWDAVKRHSVSPITLEQLIKINDFLPSLLYVVTQESIFQHPLKRRVFDIVEFLIQRRWFYPKKLKTIFYRLLLLEPDGDRLRQLFLSMDPVHKVYFLLTVFGCWQSHAQHRQLLEGLVRTALVEDNPYIWGFAVAIAAKLELALDSAAEGKELMRKMSQAEGYFGLLKWLQTINYLAQSDDERARIRELVGPGSPDLAKMLLLANITRLPTVYVDGVYLGGLLGDSGVLLLPAVCALLVAATDKVELFDSLLRFALSRLAFKQSVVSLVTQGIFDKRSASGLAEIENLKSLYVHVADDEMKQAMQSAVSRIKQYGLPCDEEFLKRHREIARYNGCFLFEIVEEGARYSYLELIPEGTLRDHIHRDLDTFRAIVDDFGAKAILPLSDVSYDSGKREVRIQFRMDRRYRVLDTNEFYLTPESIQRACVLAAQVYRKACYFRRFTGKAPRISLDNLLMDVGTGTVVFRTIGRSLCALHVFESTTVGDEEADIARMISILLETLFFKTKDELAEFKEKETYPGPEAFLALFLWNMRAKEPDHRYSCSRFVYLVEQLTRTPKPELTQMWPAVVYLRERLKGELYRFNSGSITWNGICRALNEHLSAHVRVVCSREALRRFPFRPRTLLLGQGKRQLHTLSRHLLDLALSRKDFPHAEAVDAAYSDLVEFLLLYALVCAEVLALGRTLRSTQNLQRLSSSPVLRRDRVKLRAGDCETDLAVADLAALIIRERPGKAEEAITSLSLRQLAVLCLFACQTDFRDNSVEIKKPKRMRKEVFRRFVHTCIFRIPSIEAAAERELREVFLALRLNEDFTRVDGLEKIRNDVGILSRDLRQVRREFRLSRHHGRADGRCFPPDVRCKSLFRRTCSVKEHTLPGCALTNSFPSSRDGYASSWDLQGTAVTNLMVPSEGVNSLMEDLKKGKFFGFKVSSMYSGKMMIFWDGAAFVLNGFLLAVCEYLKGSATASVGVKGVGSVFTSLLGPLAVALIGKVVLHDLGHWVPWHRQFVKFIRLTFSGEKDVKKS